MPRVFVPKFDSRFDLSDAEQYGKLEYVLPDYHFPLDVQRTMAVAREALVRLAFCPEEDYICMTGSILHVSPVFSSALQTYPRLRLLVFDAKEGKYERRNVRR